MLSSERRERGEGYNLLSHSSHSSHLHHPSQGNGISQRTVSERLSLSFMEVSPIFLYTSTYHIQYNMHPLCAELHVLCCLNHTCISERYSIWSIHHSHPARSKNIPLRFWVLLHLLCIWSALYVSGLVRSKPLNYPNNNLYIYITIRLTTSPTVSYTHKIASRRTPPSPHPASKARITPRIPADDVPGHANPRRNPLTLRTHPPPSYLDGEPQPKAISSLKAICRHLA